MKGKVFMGIWVNHIHAGNDPGGPSSKTASAIDPPVHHTSNYGQMRIIWRLVKMVVYS